MRRALPIAILLIAGCARETSGEPTAVASAQASAVPQATAAVPAPAVILAREVKEANDLYEFEYAYPVAAAAIPALRAQLDADIEMQRTALIGQAKQEKAARAEGQFPYNRLGRWIAWKVVTDLPGFLSLSASISTHEGGAHPNHLADALVWDRQAGVRRDPTDFFASKAALSRAIRSEFCRALDRERSKRRGEPVNPASGNEFDACVDPVESTIILGSSHGKAFDRLGVLVAPYTAGPYAEGAYEVTLPVSPAVLAAVKPEFRPAFALR